MLALLAAGFSFNLPTEPVPRRDALLGLSALSAAVAAPTPVYAQRSTLIPKSSKESTASFKTYQLSGECSAD